jgi:hypothetical protein
LPATTSIIERAVRQGDMARNDLIVLAPIQII